MRLAQLNTPAAVCAGLMQCNRRYVTASGTLTSTSQPQNSVLDDILALLRGRKVLDETSNTWRVYDAGGVELADPGGVLWRGVHGMLLQAALCCCRVAAAPPTFANVPRRRPPPFIPVPIPYALLDRRRDDEDALLLSTLL